MTNSALIRPAWTPATIALMVIGFIVFWPLGLAMLAYILWGDRFEGFRRDWKGSAEGAWASCRSNRHGYRGHARTGNVAFDDWREKELERLAEERRKLEELREEFDTYARELRRAKDQQEFDRFMGERNKGTAPAPTTEKPASKKGKSNDGLLDD
jgi:hypothetical protein